MPVDTQGWVPIYDVKDQCGMCGHVVTEHRMAACDFAGVDTSRV